MSLNFYQILKITKKILTLKEKKIFFFLIIFSSIVILLETFGIGSVLVLVKYFFSGIPNNILLKINEITNINFNEQNIIYYLIIIFIFFFIIKNILQIIYNIFFFKFVSQVKKRLYFKVLDDYLLKEFSAANYFSESKFYNYYHSVSSYNLILLNMNLIFSELLSTILIVFFLILLSPKLTFLVLLGAIIVFLIYSIIINKFIRKKGTLLIKIIETIEKIKLTILLGFREIKVYQKESFFLDKAEKSIEKYFTNEYENLIIKSYFKNFSEFFAIFIVFFFLFLSTKGFDNKIILETVTFILLFFVRVLPSIAKIIPSYQTIIFNFPLVNNFLNLKTNINKKTSKIIKNNTSNKAFLFFDNLSFGYSKKNIIINNFTMSFKENSIVGIYGKSGSGKTTFMDLVSGLRFPTKGNIFSNGKNIQFSNEWLGKISYISQSPFFLDETIQSNIAFGLKNDQINEKDILNCLDQAQFEYKNSNEILNHKVGLNAKFLSGGQRQRLAIARALYKKSEIFLFDEFSNALDFDTETKILQTIKKLKKDRLIFIISHDYNLIKECDIILKMNDNGILARMVR
jgi:ABC-type multidrug transport system fused ATPase/permease subunit